MDELEEIFKKLIYIGIGLAILMFVLPMISTMGLERELLRWQMIIAERNPLLLILSLLIVIVSIISIIMMLKFHPLGRTIYLWTIIISIPVSLFYGSVVMDSFSFVLGITSSMISGALLILVYFTPLKDKFNRENNATKNKISLSEELGNLNRLLQEGKISQEDFKLAKDKLLK